MRKTISKLLSKYVDKQNNIIINEINNNTVEKYLIKSNQFNLLLIPANYWKKVFKRKAIVIQPDFINQDLIKKINEKVNNIYEYAQLFIKSNINIKEEENIVYQKGDAVYDDHKKILQLNKCLVLVRDDFDKGMIDIFNFQFLFNNNELDYIYNAINSLSKKISLNSNWSGFNAYINKDILQTRGFHADSYSYRVKAFIYLTDVLRQEDGPYTFVPKSTASIIFKFINRIFSLFLYKGTESLFFRKKSVLPIYGKAGTLIISDQSESHRGFPQKKGGARAILVINSGV